jgi:hypothetical protein
VIYRLMALLCKLRVFVWCVESRPNSATFSARIRLVCINCDQYDAVSECSALLLNLANYASALRLCRTVLFLMFG